MEQSALFCKCAIFHFKVQAVVGSIVWVSQAQKAKVSGDERPRYALYSVRPQLSFFPLIGMPFIRHLSL